MGNKAVVMMMSGPVWIEHNIGASSLHRTRAGCGRVQKRAARLSRWVDGMRPSGARRDILLEPVSPRAAPDKYPG